jgi:Gpi18-like mannosyltransferase
MRSARSAIFWRRGRGALRSAAQPARGELAASDAQESSASLALWGLLALAFIVRMLFIGADGFKSDVSTFEAWALTLAEHPLRDFFAKAGFADYPPGYFFVLWVVGHAYKLLVHSDPNYTLLKVFVKMPAILMDLVCSFLIFRIVRRFASLAWAFGATALFAFNPASIFISAYWGQVDSVAAGLTLATILLVLDAYSAPPRQAGYALFGAWVVLALSILIKPPAVMLLPLLLAFVFVSDDRRVRLSRLAATGAGIVAAFFLAYLAALAFHPGLNPLGQFAWLYHRYQYASGVYPYSSVNAFNLYAMQHHFWEPDNQMLPNWQVGSLTLGLPQYGWGILLILASVALIVTVYLQRKDAAAFLEGALLLSLAYFIFSTRMHERYIFNAFVLAMPLIWMRRRYLYAAVALSLTLFANLVYSLEYLRVVDQKVAGVDPTDLMPLISHPAAILNVAVFLYLGFTYLGASGDPLERLDAGQLARAAAAAGRRWFSPLEGVARMRPLDWALATGFSLVSFVITFVHYALPPEKYFDEIYYARAAHEYIHHQEIFEYTHPPLTKLLITLSTLMLGDDSVGWRFLNLIVGALMVFVIYLFAKRLLGSTAFAAVCAGLLTFDGFHFVQSRIATPEITVAFFSLTTLYAFYRYWLASQVRVAPRLGSNLRTLARNEGVWFGVASLLALGLTALACGGQSTAAHVVVFLYIELGFYVAVRLAVPLLRRAPSLVSYADGTRITGGALETFDGGSVPLERGSPLAGETTTVVKNGLTYSDDDLKIEYARGGAVRYETPEGEASFSPDGTLSAGGARIDGLKDGRIWFWMLALSAGCLAASKWNGLFDFFVVWVWVIAVATQRYWGLIARAMGRAQTALRPAIWGNPAGFSADVVIAAMLFVGGTIYTLCYIPYFGLGHNLSDLVSLQKQMYDYHSTLTATHPYGSKWWQWPLIARPISYYYHDFRTGAALQDGHACCVAEIIALPNPAVWWLGLISVPYMGWLAWRERNKGYAVLFVAYFFQWLPWIISPRVAFEYHFFPNLAIICLADAMLLQRLWRLAYRSASGLSWPRLTVIAYGALVLAAFAFWYPVLAGVHISWLAWDARMWHFLMQNAWV